MMNDDKNKNDKKMWNEYVRERREYNRRIGIIRRALYDLKQKKLSEAYFQHKICRLMNNLESLEVYESGLGMLDIATKASATLRYMIENFKIDIMYSTLIDILNKKKFISFDEYLFVRSKSQERQQQATHQFEPS